MKKEVLGAWGESMAARYYRNCGYTLLGARYRTRFGEIDLIASKRKTIVFVEVKTRSTKRIAEPREAVTRGKQQRLIRAAQSFIQRNELSYDTPMRFDVVEVIPDEAGNAQVTCFENAFSVE